jgi:Protein kinase domain
LGKPRQRQVDLPRLHRRRGDRRISPVDRAAVENGTIVGGFRIDRLIGAGITGAVYEATQLSLGRSVALRLIGAEHFSTAADLAQLDEQQRLTAALHHPNLVAWYAAGEWEGGRFIATRFIRGVTLADLLGEAIAPSAEALEPLGDALRLAHDAGLVHGRVSSRNVLVEASGGVYLTDLGLGRPGSAEGDMTALTEVLSAASSVVAPRRRRRSLILGLAAVGAAAIAALALALGGGHGGDDQPADAVAPPAEDTTALGSSFASAGEPLGCSDPPNPNTPACTLAQTRLGGAALVVPRAGVIRNWVVRGVSGTVDLQVVRQRGPNSFVAGFSQPMQVSGAGTHAFAADIGVQAGDQIAIKLEPGATIEATRGAAGSVISRWDGALTADPRPSTGTVSDAVLALRVDVEFGAKPEGARQIDGEEAASAPAGTTVSDTPLRLPVAGGVRVTVVKLPAGIALDVLGDRRLARIEVPDADPAGELLELTLNCGPVVPGGFCLRWRNPGTGPPLEHQYVVRDDGRIHQNG